jgi:hypothetical protein
MNTYLKDKYFLGIKFKKKLDPVNFVFISGLHPLPNLSLGILVKILNQIL